MANGPDIPYRPWPTSRVDQHRVDSSPPPKLARTWEWIANTFCIALMLFLLGAITQSFLNPQSPAESAHRWARRNHLPSSIVFCDPDHVDHGWTTCTIWPDPGAVYQLQCNTSECRRVPPPRRR